MYRSQPGALLAILFALLMGLSDVPPIKGPDPPNEIAHLTQCDRLPDPNGQRVNETNQERQGCVKPGRLPCRGTRLVITKLDRLAGLA